MDMDIGLKYQALFGGQVDVIVVFTTDGQLAEATWWCWKTTSGSTPRTCAATWCASTRWRLTPSCAPSWKSWKELISDDDMARMNHAVESEGANPRTSRSSSLPKGG